MLFQFGDRNSANIYKQVKIRVLVLIFVTQNLKNLILLITGCHVHNLHRIAMRFFAWNTKNYVFA
jgi:hypothetical protein